MFGDEASFWLDGTLHRTWSRVGVQPRVDTFGTRKTAHVFGALSLEAHPRFRLQSRRCSTRSPFMISSSILLGVRDVKFS